MTGPSTARSQAAYQRRFAYEELRESGLRPADAARELGISYNQAMSSYEPWYLQRHPAARAARRPPRLFLSPL